MDATDDVMNTVSEFIYFRVEPTVKPEDPNSDEGYALLRVFEAAKAQCAYRSSAWGRSVEDESVIVWVVGVYFLSYICFTSLPSIQSSISDHIRSITRNHILTTDNRMDRHLRRHKLNLPQTLRPPRHAHPSRLRNSDPPNPHNRDPNRQPRNGAVRSRLRKRPAPRAANQAQLQPGALPLDADGVVGATGGPAPDVLDDGVCGEARDGSHGEESDGQGAGVFACCGVA